MLQLLEFATSLMAALIAGTTAPVAFAVVMLERAEYARTIRSENFPRHICDVIGVEADKRGLPRSFFARLIWKESLFDPFAVSHKGAEGIAQFIPSTAAERGLTDAFHPDEAVAASAHFLADLRGDFGSLGLAAAAYNAGPTRVANWLAGAGPMPLETQEYVHAITGHLVEEWRDEPETLQPLEVSAELPFQAACPRLAARALRPMRPAQPFQPIAGQVVASTGQTLTGSGAAKASSPWAVQIAVHFSKDVALSRFSEAKKRHSAVLGAHAPMVVSVKNRSRGNRPMHSVRVGANSKASADQLCGKLRSAGGACMVVKN